MRQFTWWRRFHTTRSLPKKYLYKGASELLQRIEFGEYEYNHLGREVYLEDKIYQSKLNSVLEESPWLQGESLDEHMEYERKQLNKRKALILKNNLEAEQKLLIKLKNDLASEFNLERDLVESTMETFDGTTRELFFKCMSISTGQEINLNKRQRLIQPQPMHILKPKEQKYYPLWKEVVKERKFQHEY